MRTGRGVVNQCTTTFDHWEEGVKVTLDKKEHHVTRTLLLLQ